MKRPNYIRPLLAGSLIALAAFASVTSFATFATVGVGCSSSSDDTSDSGVVTEGDVNFTKIDPASAPAKGGDTVTIMGAGFVEPVEVLFGDIPAKSVKVVSETELQVVTPKHLAAVVDVTVQLKDKKGMAKALSAFTFNALDLQFRSAAEWALPSFDPKPTDIIAADFTSDGFDDLLLAMGNQPAILLVNSGTGTFVNPDDPTAKPEPNEDAGTQDADASPTDGSPSEAGIDGGRDSGSDGGTPEPTVRTWDYHSGKMIGEDLNGDGITDIILCNRNGQGHQVFVSNGAGTFSAVLNAFPLTDDACVDAVLVDVNNDKKKDLVVLGRGKSGGGADYVRVFTRKDSGDLPSFALAAGLEPAAKPGIACGSAKNVTEGLKVKGITAESPGGSSSTVCEISFESTAETELSFTSTYTLPSTPALPTAVEFKLRKKAVGELKGTIQLVDQDDEVFEQAFDPVQTSWKTVRVGNLNNFTPVGEAKNGKLDLPLKKLIITLKTSTKVDSVYLDDVILDVPKVGTVLIDDFERKEHTLTWTTSMSSIAAGDLDNDGYADVVVASNQKDKTPRVAWARNNGTADVTFAHRPSAVLNMLPDAVGAVTLFDGDGDGNLDIVLGTSGQDRLLTNDGKGRFFDDTPAFLPLDRSTATSIESADLNLDGHKDLIIATSDSVNRLYLCNPEHGFIDRTPSLPLDIEETIRLVPFDADGDGDLDLFLLAGKDPKTGNQLPCAILISSEPSK